MMSRTGFLGLILVVCLGCAFAEPIKLHRANPHYYLFNGQPTILITSAEHYGGVINKDFDYVAYFDALKSYGLNYTRIYAGAMFEPIGKFGDGNPLAPKPQSLILPWGQSKVPGYLHGGNKFDLDQWNPGYFERLKDFIAKAAESLTLPWGQSKVPGYLHGGNKFDLDQWNPAYFERLKDFIAKAAGRGIVVEICFFNAQYSDTWPISPLYYENNIQGEGKCAYQDAQTLKHRDVVRRESDYVRKITEEVNAYDNVILEICDEAPDVGTPPTPLADAGAWVSHLVDVVTDTEKNLPKKHLVAVQVEGPVGGPLDLSGNPKVSVIVTQYVWQAGLQMGGMKGLELEYAHHKPIEFNETAWYPLWYKGDAIADSRVEAWEFIVGGGGSFNHLNGRYTPSDPAGKTPDNAQIASALKNLRDFIYSFDFLKMSPDKGFVVSGVPAGVYCRGISETGKQYALYHHHSRYKEDYTSSYVVTPGSYVENLELTLPGGSYKADWVDPASGAVLGSETFTHQGGNRIFTTPTHTVDVALRIKRP